MAQVRAAQRTIGIIGAGICGPVFALQVLSHPVLRSLYKPVVYDQGPDPRASTELELSQTAGAAIGMSPNGLYPLYQLGLRDAIEKASRDIVGNSSWRASYGANHRPLQSVDVVAPGTHKLLSRSENASWAEDVQSNMRAMERRLLSSLLLDRVNSLGGQIIWNTRLESLESLSPVKTKAVFDNEKEAVFDMVVGANGGWSAVRKHILESRDNSAVEKRWAPDFAGASNVYGISSDVSSPQNADPNALLDTHGLWLDHGIMSTSPLPEGKIRWDLMVPDSDAGNSSVQSPLLNDYECSSGWESKIAPGLYPRSRTVELLRKHAGVYHPAAGTFGRLLAASERIIHAPLNHRVWEENEIQCGNAVLIGDAARLMLPSSGSGTAFAVEDATVLANAILNNPPRSEDDGFQKAFEEYARLRVPRSKRMASQSYYLARVAFADKWYWKWLRNLMTALMKHIDSKNPSKKHVSAWPLNERVEVRLKDRL